LNRFIGSTIPLLAEVVENASFAEKEFELYKIRKKQE